MSENPVMLKLKALNVATTTINRPLRVRSIKLRGKYTLQMLYLQRQ